MKRLFLIFIFLLIATGLLWRFWFSKEKFVLNIPDSVKVFNIEKISDQLQSVKDQVLAPPPLKSKRQSPSSNLSIEGVVKWTNIQRGQNGNLPALSENILLNRAAALKLQDLFDKQYFEHISPTGQGPADLAKNAGYAYISIGENLALGNFDNDEVLVQDWMDSPGHRENILNIKYTEIGVAVGKGLYKGEETWIAVQEFGRPASSCPQVDANLKKQISDLQTEVDAMQLQLDTLKNQLEALLPEKQDEYQIYNQKVLEFNNFVRIYNNKVDNLKLLTSQYNAQVASYNTCLGK